MSSTGLPGDWEVRHSNSKNLPYYFSPSSKESSWEPPAGTDPEKLKNYMATYHSSGAQFSSRVNGANGQKNGAKIRAAHLLVKHRNSRRRTSWREKEITRSEADADRMIRSYLKRIKSGEISLGDLAVRESDCSSARKRGDLGYFGKGDMQEEFELRAFELQPGQISGKVETESGYHIIERLE